MKRNLPVTDNEIVMAEGQVIISETDLKGRITGVNQCFMNVSGYSNEELIGKSHNLVRHPDMPEAAFQWLWDTIQAGKPWTGFVKNRAKNGDFYWVHAHVTGIVENGRITGYLSVRTKPTRQQIDAAAALYADINSGKVILGKKSLLEKINFIKRMKIWQKIAATILLTAVLLTGSWLLTLAGLGEMHDDLKMAGNDRRVALAAANINMSVLAVMIDLKRTQTILEPEAYQHSIKFMDEMLVEVKQDIGLIEAADLGEEERAAASEFVKSVEAYIGNTLKPVKVAMQEEEEGRFNEIVIHLNNEDYEKMQKTDHLFGTIQTRVSEEEASGAEEAFVEIRNHSTISAVMSLILALVFSWILLRGLIRRLKYTSDKLDSIQEGNYFDWVDIGDTDEIGDMLDSMKSMQTCQGYSILRVTEQANEALKIKNALDQVASPVQIADNDYNIFYTNLAADRLFKSNQEFIRKQISDFDADKVMGTNVDMFHKDPSHQRRLLDSLQGQYVSDDIAFDDDFVVKVAATPVQNEAGERIATIVEWDDRTVEIKVEKEIAKVFSAAQQGSFSERIGLDDKSGFFAQLSEMVNTLNGTLEQAFDDIGKAVDALNRGDLTHRIGNDYEGTFDDIKQSTNDTSEKLSEVIGNVIRTAKEVDTGSDEISEGNNTLNTRTQEQAAALEETAASIEEIAGTVQQTADNSRQANQLAVDAKEQAEKGGSVANQAVEAMSNISASSRKISDIIGVIDEIAFQTNLLALNAAVEAARAGEQGRGFAVVAAEVRSLAQRSAEAAKEIKVLINQSVVSVDAGSRLVDESGSALTEIVGAVAKVGNIIAEIAAASTEQTSGIDQINKAIAQLDAGTQQNTALVEESAAASQNLSEQANELRQQVGVFDLGEGSTSPVATAAKAQPQRSKAKESRKQAAAPLPRPQKKQSTDDDVWEEF